MQEKYSDVFNKQENFSGFEKGKTEMGITCISMEEYTQMIYVTDSKQEITCTKPLFNPRRVKYF